MLVKCWRESVKISNTSGYTPPYKFITDSPPCQEVRSRLCQIRTGAYDAPKMRFYF